MDKSKDQEVKMKFKNSVTNFKRLGEYEERLKSLKKVIESMPKNVILDGNEMTKSLQSTNKLLESLNKNFSKFDKNSTKSFSNIADTVNEINKKTVSASENTKKFKNVVNTAMSVGKLKVYYQAMQQIVQGMSKFISYSSNYIENLNLTDVAYQGATREARRFVNELSEMYGLDESSLVRTVGLFKQLANAMGLSNELGAKMSKTLTIMANDISSLYNTSFERAVSVLESSLAGQTKPIRGLTGADITQTTLQITLDNYGIDTTVNELSYLEKRLIIVTSLINQLDESQNDYGRTIESVANQMRIFEQQTQRLSRAIGNVFIPILSSALPYLNGILMATTEIIDTIARLLGFREEDYDYFGASNESIEDLIEDLNQANTSANKLNKSLRSFDKLNVITTPTTKASGFGNVDPKILDAFNSAISDYDSKIDKVRMKANDIRDSIMKTLGFQRELNKSTGEWEWKYQGLGVTFSNLLDIFNDLPGIWKIIIGLGINKTVFNLIGNAKTLGTILSTKVFGNSIFSSAKTLTGLFKDDLSGGIYGLRQSLGESYKMWDSNLTKMDKVKNTILGVGGLHIGFNLLNDGIKKVSENSKSLVGNLESAGGALTNVLSGALMGSAFGPIGTMIGAITSAITTMYDVFTSDYDPSIQMFQNMLDKIKDVNTAYANSFRLVYEEVSSENWEIGRIDDLVNELESLVDSNGNVKKGYEDRVKFITTELSNAYGIEAQLIDGKIKDYDKYIAQIKETIKQKQLEIKQELYTDAYKNSYNQRIKLYQNMKDAEEKYSASKTRYSEKASKENEKAMNEAKTLYEQSKTNYKNNIIIMDEYSNFVTGVLENNEQKIILSSDRIEKALAENATSTKYTYSDMINEANIKTEEFLSKKKTTYDKLTEEDKKYVDGFYKNTVESLIAAIKGVDEVTPETKKAWDKLAVSNKEAYLEALGKLTPEERKKLEKTPTTLGEIFSQAIQKGLNKYIPKVNISSNAQEVLDTLNKNLPASVKNAWSTLTGALSTISKAFNFNLPRLKTGIDFVPNDFYPAFLDYGERVLTKEENQEYMKNKGINQTTINNSSKPINATFVIQVGNKEIGREVLKNLQDMADANGKPIVIGG